ncbi:MAG: hypothetical protein RQ751_14195, partial [Longimicrobiales bacterium]|nr:hypothetical protein [Longimicrobiales bacterium]
LSVQVLGTVVFTSPNQEGCSDFTRNTPPSKLWVCALGDLAAGAERTLLLRVLAQAEEMITTTAEITAFSGATDPDGADQLVEGAVQVVPYAGSTEVLFGVDSSNDALFRVNPLTGSNTRVGTNLGTGFATPVAMGMVPATEDLLVWTNSPALGLGTVNVCTGVGTVERTFPSLKPAQAMAVRSDGTVYLFAGDAQGNALYRMDPPYTSAMTLDGNFPIRAAGAEFTATGRLFAIDLTSGQPVRLLEVDPVTGEILQTINVTDQGGAEIATGVLGTMVWNPDTGQFLVTSTQSFQGQGRAFFDLSLEGVVSNVRTFGFTGWGGQGGQGMAFRSAPLCGG